MPSVSNPTKSFNFRIEIAGLDQFEAQEVKFPEVEIEAVEHGDTNYMVKTGGMVKVGTMEITKLKALAGTDTWAWNWLEQVQNTLLGSGTLPANYKRSLVIRELAPDGITTIAAYLCEGCWPSKIAPEGYNRGASNNLTEKVTMSVDRVIKMF